MDKYKIIQVKESVFADNDREADRVRQQLKKQGTFLLNLMSSPGSGKTTTLLRTVEGLKDQLRMGVMEADIDSDVDAATISREGAKVIQLHTGGQGLLLQAVALVLSGFQTQLIAGNGVFRALYVLLRLRKALAAVGLLDRDLRPGQWRPLTQAEVKVLREESFLQE